MERYGLDYVYDFLYIGEVLSPICAVPGVHKLETPQRLASGEMSGRFTHRLCALIKLRGPHDTKEPRASSP